MLVLVSPTPFWVLARDEPVSRFRFGATTTAADTQIVSTPLSFPYFNQGTTANHFFSGVSTSSKASAPLREKQPAENISDSATAMLPNHNIHGSAAHLDTGGHTVTHTAMTDHNKDNKPATPGHVPGGKNSNADRVGLYNPESGICGSHTKMDLDGYLALTRRKVAEKYSTTLDLITHIRRNRFGESGYVTPNEFRYTLIKLGVQMPGPMADKIFEIFDSDRSGSINFDEFAMWVMNR